MLEILVARALNKHQILILKDLAENGNYIVVTNLIDKISSENNIPESTVRWNIKQLREMGLLDCGTKDHKGVPAKLTDSGKYLVNKLGGVRNDI